MRRDETRQRGAALVEFAVLAPLLVLLVLGIIEFGWLFGQYNDIRHGAREGARFAAVDGGNSDEIAMRVCQTMDGFGAGLINLTISLDPDPDGSDTSNIGEVGSIRVEATVGSLTSAPLITTFLPGSLASEVEFMLEQKPSWTKITVSPSC